MLINMYKSGFNPVRQDLSGEFGCPVLSSQETHVPSPVEPYPNDGKFYDKLICNCLGLNKEIF